MKSFNTAFKNTNNYNKLTYNDKNKLTYNDKKDIINYIYSKINISKYKYKLLEYNYDLEEFNPKEKYYVSANFSGFNNLLVFCKIRNNKYSVLVDRKSLSFNYEQIKIETVKMDIINIHIDDYSIYNGTIIDGIYIKHDKRNENFFVITDLFEFKGEICENDKINNKLTRIETYLKYNIKNNKSKLTFSINKLYELEQIDKLIHEDIFNTHDFHVRGISFFPEVSNTKLIYVFNPKKDILNKTISNGLKNLKNNSDELVREANYESNKKIIKKFIVKNNLPNKNVEFNILLLKTNIVDVYKLYINNINKLKKIGIAYIPTKECSIMVKTAFSNTNKDKLIFKCKLNLNKNKWTPIQYLDNILTPDSLKDINTKIDIIDEEIEIDCD